jgi:hypothetical protein
MTHDELRDLYELYALGLLEPAERGEIDEHIGRGCETCKSGVRRALITNHAILSFVPDTAPRKLLRRRVLSSFGLERQNWGWLAAWGALTACLLVGVLWFSVDAQRNRNELALVRRQAARSAAELTRVGAVLEFLNSPETRRVTFGKDNEQPPRGTILVNPSGGVLLVASNLPQLSSGKTYEMWTIAKGAPPKPAGLFESDASGHALHLVRGPVDPATTAVAVSVEPESGSAAPTTAPIVVAQLPGS